MRLVNRLHGYQRRKEIDHHYQVKHRILFSLCGLIPILFLVFLMLAACGGSSPSTSGPTVSAIDNAFSPTQLHIKAGETVTWVNNGQTSHTVTADDNSYNQAFLIQGPNIRIHIQSLDVMLIIARYMAVLAVLVWQV